MTSGVVELAAGHDFPIHVYAYGGGYRGTFFPPPVSSTAHVLVRQVAENQDPVRRLRRGRELLDAAAQGMAALLAPFGLVPPPLGPAGRLEDLRLAEARVRREYYALLDTVLPPYWSILKRERRPPRRPADALLGFANGILYAKTAGWLHRAGLDPRIGYLHGDARAANPLALDLAEAMKPAVSEAALLTVAASGQERSLVTDVGEGCYLNEKGRKLVIQTLEGLLEAPTRVAVLDRDLSLGRVGELLATKLHRAVALDEPAAFPLPSCTLSSSTTRTLKQDRTSVGSS
jgi:CRISPR-associated protein Cas1